MAGSPIASTNDSIIGLHVGCRVFYCHRSTLANAESGSYFERRFGAEHKFSEDVAYVGANGTKIYFIERDGDLFGHVLQYLIRLTLNLPPYAKNKPLWKDLRLEAEFFGLDGLADILSATHTCPYNEDAKGIFYWLGTARGTSHHADYVNPLKIRGRGENRNTILLEIQVGVLEEKNNFFQDHSDTKESANLLQYRQKIDMHINIGNLAPIDGNTSLWLQPADPRQTYVGVALPLGMAPPPAIQQQPDPQPRVLKFNTILVRPTHVSIRVPSNEILAMPPAISLEASLDGRSWDRPELKSLSSLAEQPPSSQDMNREMDAILAQPRAPMLQSMNRLIDVAEHFLRRAWAVEGPREYYKYFRFASPTGHYTDLAGVALEVFGDVQEE